MYLPLFHTFKCLHQRIPWHSWTRFHSFQLINFYVPFQKKKKKAWLKLNLLHQRTYLGHSLPTQVPIPHIWGSCSLNKYLAITHGLTIATLSWYSAHVHYQIVSYYFQSLIYLPFPLEGMFFNSRDRVSFLSISQCLVWYIQYVFNERRKEWRDEGARWIAWKGGGRKRGRDSEREGERERGGKKEWREGKWKRRMNLPNLLLLSPPATTMDISSFPGSFFFVLKWSAPCFRCHSAEIFLKPAICSKQAPLRHLLIWYCRKSMCFGLLPTSVYFPSVT